MRVIYQKKKKKHKNESFKECFSPTKVGEICCSLLRESCVTLSILQFIYIFTKRRPFSQNTFLG